jgi:GNAT superfamily N-acetyltransferase
MEKSVVINRAGPGDASVVAALVMELTAEIGLKCEGVKFQQDAALTAKLCAEWISDGRYTVLLAYVGEVAAGVATIAETYALYAGGRIGVIQECFVAPGFRAQAIGHRLIEAALSIGIERSWACTELCTPPLPEFAQAIDFYQRHGFVSVGGRKMRRQFQPE